MTDLILPTRRFFLMGGGAALLAACGTSAADEAVPMTVGDFADSEWRQLTEDQWRERLSPEAFYILREDGTERRFTSPLNDEKREGVYHCAGCDLPLFSSETKYDSGTGWPSFWQPLTGAVGTKPDNSFFMQRTEYHCARCLGHQGHVFEDGPRPTGLRYCNNGLALTFRPSAA